MKSFDDAWKENRHVWESTKNLAKAMYLAGAQSRQSEVDELKKRIDDALRESEDFCNFGDGESAMSFCNEIINILKGEQDV